MINFKKIKSEAHECVRRVKTFWGPSLAGLFILLTIIRALLEKTPGHYLMFIHAARDLWAGHQAYGVPYIGNLFFYSPSCALFLFGPLSLLPLRVGLFIFLAASGVILIYGTFKFIRVYAPLQRMNWFWILIIPQIISGLGSHKLEVATVGILFLAASWIIPEKSSRSKIWASAFLMAMVVNWKLQPFPAVMMISVAILFLRREISFVIALGVSFIFWFGTPFLVSSPNFMFEAHHRWKTSLEGYSAVSYFEFDNLFSFMKNSLGIDLSYLQAQEVTALGALSFGILFLWGCFRFSKVSESVLWALVLGLAYTVFFSPLQQVQAYIMFAPVYLIASIFYLEAPKSSKKTWLFLIGITFVVLTFAYSDLVPENTRHLLRHLTVRTPACLFLLVAVSFQLLKQQGLKGRLSTILQK